MSQPSDPTPLRLSAEYEHALARYEGLSLQLSDLDGVLEDLNGSLNEAVNAQAQADALAAVQQPADAGDELEQRVLSLRDDVNRTEETIAKLTVDCRGAYDTERRLYWRDTVTYEVTHPDVAIEHTPDGPVRYESVVGGPDIVDGMSVQAGNVPVTGRQQIPARKTQPIPSTQDRARLLRAQQQRQQPGRGFGR